MISFGAGGSSRTISANVWSATGETTPTTVTGAVNLLATSGATWQLTGVQLEVGSVATPFERRPYGTELALCQRYYETGIVGSGGRTTDGFGTYPGQFKVTKRAAPTVTYVAAGAAGGLGGYFLGPNVDGFVGYSVSTTVNSSWYFTYTAAIEL